MSFACAGRGALGVIGEVNDAMRSIAYIVPTFWTRGSGKKLRGNDAARVLAFYLMTAPQSNYMGLYYSPIAHIANDLGWAVEKVRVTFPDIIEIAQYDEDSELVWVPATLKHQTGGDIGPKDKRRVNIEKSLRLIGDHPFVNEFRELYGFPLLDSKKIGRKEQEGGLEGGFDAPSKGHPQLPDAPSIPSPSLPLSSGGDARGTGAKIKIADFYPGREHWTRAQELKLPTERVESALKAFKEKVKKTGTEEEHSKTFMNFLESEAALLKKSGEKSSDDEEPSYVPHELFWYRRYLEEGKLKEAEFERKICVEKGYLTEEN